MVVIEQPHLDPAPIPGIAHATYAGAGDGLQQLSVWRQSMAPGASTPPHSHDCDEVVLCLAGTGEVCIDGAVHRFTREQTIILPKGTLHQLFNVGAMQLETIGIFAATPVTTRLPDGQVIDLPWRT